MGMYGGCELQQRVYEHPESLAAARIRRSSATLSSEKSPKAAFAPMLLSTSALWVVVKPTASPGPLARAAANPEKLSSKMTQEAGSTFKRRIASRYGSGDGFEDEHSSPIMRCGKHELSPICCSMNSALTRGALVTHAMPMSCDCKDAIKSQKPLRGRSALEHDAASRKRDSLFEHFEAR